MDSDQPWMPGLAAGSPGWLPEDRITRTVVALTAASLISDCTSALGRYTDWKQSINLRLELAGSIRDQRPYYLARALMGKAGLARAVGDRPGFLAVEQELEKLAAEDNGDGDLIRPLFGVRTSNAAIMRDWTTYLKVAQERLSFVLQLVRRQAEEADLPDRLETVEEVLDFLHARGDRTLTAAIGNACLNQGTALYHRGDTRIREEAVDTALSLFRTACHAYEGYGGNGFSAVRLSRARMLVSAATHRIKTAEATDEFLELSHIGLEGALRRNALLEAARLGTPGDERVLARLEEVLAGPVSTHHPRLKAALALWHRRNAQINVETANWELVEALAREAAGELVVEGRHLDAPLSLECWSTVLEAHRHQHGDTSPEQEMQISLQAVHCLAVHLLTVTHPAERARVAQEHAQVYPDAADLAVRLGDAQAAELVMEAVRRNRVGLLLGELSTNPEVGQVVREAASRIVAANAAVPDIRDITDQDASRSWTTRSVADITANQAAALEAAASVIGPASVLADFGQLPVLRSEHLVRQGLAAGRARAVLQLYRVPAPTPGGQDRLFWAVTVPDGDQVVSTCGLSLLPYIGEFSLEEADFWTVHAALAFLLLPEPLRTYLRDNRGQWPVELVIVPTGLLGIPFDNLAVDDETLLIDCADVVFTGSLAMTDALSSRPPEDAAPKWLSVYDHHRLAHAVTESQAMANSHAPVDQAEGAAALHQALGGAGRDYEVFALGVHGSQDRTGWGQTKLLPDGTSVTAAEALRWSAPRYSVLSSCHSTMETIEGSELSGFPAALLLRGSTTVIGSLHAIDDAATAAVMARCWILLGAGHPPSHALAEAKRQWLHHHPDQWPQPWLWAPLITYGTH
ncbi:CHAT domain-containing protein [Kocuria sp. CPCC 205268]